MQRFSRWAYALFFLVIFSAPLHAYIDPASGSLLVSGLIGIILTAAFTLKGIFYRIFTGFVVGRSVGLNDFTDRLVFFSEGRNYWKVFKPVLQELIGMEKNFVYLSADRGDPGLTELTSPCMKTHCLTGMKQAAIFMSRIKADIVVMTTPQLGIFQFKRSRDVRHYCHLLHAPVDIHTYKKFSFDYFDSVLCSSVFQMQNLRQLERDRHKPEKQLFETGCTYYDLVPKAKESERDVILLAPTWGEKSFLAEEGEELIDQILRNGYKLIFRPHPQSWISELKLLERIESRFAHHLNFTVDRSPDNHDSLSRAKLMICDFSGVIYDFIFTQKRPVIAIEREWKDGGYESSDLEEKPSTYDLLEQAGLIVCSSDLNKICPELEKLGEITIGDALRDRFVFHYGRAGKVAAKQILAL